MDLLTNQSHNIRRNENKCLVHPCNGLPPPWGPRYSIKDIMTLKILNIRKVGIRGDYTAVLHAIGVIHQDQGNYKEALDKYTSP